LKLFNFNTVFFNFFAVYIASMVAGPTFISFLKAIGYFTFGNLSNAASFKVPYMP